MIYISEAFLIIANIIMAYHHSELINEGRKIKHGWWGLAYLGFAGLLSLLHHSWLLFIVSLPIRKVFFDLSLNYFRALSLWYQSTQTTSIIDKLHSGINPKVYLSVYTASIIVINFFQ